MQDNLGVRMKKYEASTSFVLPRRTYIILRLDGKTFSTWTRGLDKPYDSSLQKAMVDTAIRICEEISGAKFAYTQSDEISILLTDFDSIHTEPWFGGKIQKIASVSASMATAFFNESKNKNPALENRSSALFDSRVFIIPDPVEIMNYFRWRQQDATRNSITGLAQKYFSHKALQNKSCDQMQEMLWQEHGINWNDVTPSFKRGITISRFVQAVGGRHIIDSKGFYQWIESHPETVWRLITPDFFKDGWLENNIPNFPKETI